MRTGGAAWIWGLWPVCLLQSPRRGLCCSRVKPASRCRLCHLWSSCGQCVPREVQVCVPVLCVRVCEHLHACPCVCVCGRTLHLSSSGDCRVEMRWSPRTGPGWGAAGVHGPGWRRAGQSVTPGGGPPPGASRAGAGARPPSVRAGPWAAASSPAPGSRPLSPQFLCLKNIRTFLKVCHDKFGLRNSELFDPFDLFDVRDFGKVSAPLRLPPGWRPRPAGRQGPSKHPVPSRPSVCPAGAGGCVPTEGTPVRSPHTGWSSLGWGGGAGGVHIGPASPLVLTHRQAGRCSSRASLSLRVSCRAGGMTA